MKTSPFGLLLVFLVSCSEPIEYAGPDFVANLPKVLAPVPSDLGDRKDWFDPGTRVGVHYTYFTGQKSEYRTPEDFIDWFTTAYEIERPKFVETSIGHRMAIEFSDGSVNIFLVSDSYDEIWLVVTYSIRVDGDLTAEAQELVLQTVAGISAGHFNTAYMQ
jgi:hypothetical protein